MGRTRAIGVLLAALVCAPTANGQNVTQHGAVGRVELLESIISSDAPRMAFEMAHARARELRYSVSTQSSRGRRVFGLPPVDCQLQSGIGYACEFPIPPEVISIVRADGRVMLTVTVHDGVGSAESAGLQVTPPETTCRYVAPDGSVGTRPLHTAIGGIMSPPATETKSTAQLVAERIGMMRRDGWRVEWQWDSDDDRLVVLMWCLGYPQ